MLKRQCRKKIKRAIRQLDNDISAEALPVMGKMNYDAIEVAMSGAVGTVVYLEDSDLHIANIGRCFNVVLSEKKLKGFA